MPEYNALEDISNPASPANLSFLGPMTPDMNNNKPTLTVKPENKPPLPGMSSFVMSPKSPEYDPDAILSDANSQRIATPANEYHSASEAFTPTLIMNPDRNNNVFSPISTEKFLR